MDPSPSTSTGSGFQNRRMKRESKRSLVPILEVRILNPARARRACLQASQLQYRCAAGIFLGGSIVLGNNIRRTLAAHDTQPQSIFNALMRGDLGVIGGFSNFHNTSLLRTWSLFSRS